MEAFDCELIRSGWPAQPVNAVSAIGFVVVGVLLWRSEARLAAGFAVAVGVGSGWFHSDPGGTSQWAHDITLYALVALAAIEVWRRLAAGRPPWLAAGLVLGGGIVWWASRTGGPLCAPDSLVQGHAAWHLLAAAATWALFAVPTADAEQDTSGL